MRDSRIRMFDVLPRRRFRCLVFHMLWPGLGQFAKRGDGFRYVPSPMQLAW